MLWELWTNTFTNQHRWPLPTVWYTNFCSHEQNCAVACRHLEKEIEAKKGPGVRQRLANCSDNGGNEGVDALLDVAAAHGLDDAVAC